MFKYLQNSPIEDKEVIVGKDGNESIPIKIHKSLHYPTHFSKQITNIESHNNEYFLIAQMRNLDLMIMFFVACPLNNQKNC